TRGCPGREGVRKKPTILNSDARTTSRNARPDRLLHGIAVPTLNALFRAESLGKGCRGPACPVTGHAHRPGPPSRSGIELDREIARGVGQGECARPWLTGSAHAGARRLLRIGSSSLPSYRARPAGPRSSFA